MGQRFDRRGRRTDEMLELIRALWQPGWTEFDGETHQTPRLEMEPTPPPIPIYEGGINHILTIPWMFYSGPEATLAEKIDGMKRFRKDLKLDG